MYSSLEIFKEIMHPSEEFSPIPFWFFNDEPEEERIAAQLQDYVQKGVNGIVLHPRIGIPETVEYLSEAYFAAVRFIVKTAAGLGMKIVLYDEGMYPSGSAHGKVVASNPDFASKGITLVGKGDALPQDGEVILELPEGERIVYAFTGGTIRGIHFGEDDGEPGAPKSADILNPRAVDTFIRLTHDRYYEELKEYFGNTVIAFFTDEPGALGRNAGSFREWVPGMEEELRSGGGKPEELKGLFEGVENATTILYHKLIKKHLRETFYARLSRWCESHGIALMGHPESSDDIEEELYFHIPGQDLILRRVSPEEGGLLQFDSVQAKLSADIARHLGRRRNANECFGVCFRNKIPWYFTGSDMKWYLDWLGIRGVNLFVPHAFYYSVEGGRSEERPPDVGPHNIWWQHYGKVSNYMKRLSYLMTDSGSRAKVAVLCDNNRVPYQEVACLYENQIEFHYLPLAFLQRATVDNGRLSIGGCTYEVVLNPGFEGVELNPGPEGVELNPGPEGVELNPGPEGVELNPGFEGMERNPHFEGMRTESQVRVVSDAGELLEDDTLRGVLTETPCRNLRIAGLCKTVKDSREGVTRVNMYLFSNEGEETISTGITLPGEQGQGTELVMVDLWRGEAWRATEEIEKPEKIEKSEKIEKKENVSFFLNLAPRETLLVIADREGDIAGVVSEKAKELFLGDLTERFVKQEEKDNSVIYTMHYQTDVVDKGESFLVRGEEMARFFCNGQFVDASLWSPHRFHMGPYLQEGDNELKLVLTGNAANIYCQADIPFGLGT